MPPPPSSSPTRPRARCPRLTAPSFASIPATAAAATASTSSTPIRRSPRRSGTWPAAWATSPAPRSSRHAAPACSCTRRRLASRLRASSSIRRPRTSPPRSTATGTRSSMPPWSASRRRTCASSTWWSATRPTARAACWRRTTRSISPRPKSILSIPAWIKPPPAACASWSSRPASWIQRTAVASASGSSARLNSWAHSACPTRPSSTPIRT